MGKSSFLPSNGRTYLSLYPSCLQKGCGFSTKLSRLMLGYVCSVVHLMQVAHRTPSSVMASWNISNLQIHGDLFPWKFRRSLNESDQMSSSLQPNDTPRVPVHYYTSLSSEFLGWTFIRCVPLALLAARIEFNLPCLQQVTGLVICTPKSWWLVQALQSQHHLYVHSSLCQTRITKVFSR